MGDRSASAHKYFTTLFYILAKFKLFSLSLYACEVLSDKQNYINTMHARATNINSVWYDWKRTCDMRRNTATEA